MWRALNSLCQRAQLVSLGAYVQQDLIQTHSGVCTEANLCALHQQCSNRAEVYRQAADK